MTDASNDTDNLPPPSAPESIPFSMRAFASAEDANRLANRLASYVRLISRCMDLSQLDGVTVAYDYDAALAELDRGVEGLRMLTRSNDDQLIGVGMAPAVVRDGIVKVHVVLNGPYVEGIEADDAEEPSEAFSTALYLLAHECAHVQVTTDKDHAFPGTILQRRISGYEEAIFIQINEACWEEYAACRLSAVFGLDQLQYYEEGLRGVLGVAREQAALAREAFWNHRDLMYLATLTDLEVTLRFPMKRGTHSRLPAMMGTSMNWLWCYAPCGVSDASGRISANSTSSPTSRVMPSGPVESSSVQRRTTAPRYMCGSPK
jgi:hypothetical protein